MVTPFNKANVIICLKNKISTSVKKCGNVHVLDNNMIEVVAPKVQPKTFGPFDKILDQKTTNQRIFFEGVKPYVDGAFEGLKTFVISYGFSSSGKTAMLFGSDLELTGGVVMEALNYAFKKCSESNLTKTMIKISVFELCGDRFFDLASADKHEISVNVDNDNKLVIKDIMASKINSVEEACAILKYAVDRRSSNLNYDLEITSRSHVFVKLEIINEMETGIIKFGEVLFGDLCTSNLMCDKDDKQIYMDVAATKNGYMFLNVLLEKMLKRPDLSHPFRDSMLGYLLKPVLLGMYAASMIFSLTIDNTPSDAISSFGIADKFRQLKCNPIAETELSMRMGRRPGMLLVSKEHIPDLKDIDFIVIDADDSRQKYLENIEKNRKALEQMTNELRALDIELEESRRKDKLSKERYEAALEENRKVNEKLLGLKLHKKQLEGDLKSVKSKKEDAVMECNAQKKLHEELLGQHQEFRSMFSESFKASNDLKDAIQNLNGIVDKSIVKNEEGNSKIISKSDELIELICKLQNTLEMENIANSSKMSELEVKMHNYGAEVSKMQSEMDEKISQRNDLDVVEESISSAKKSLELIVSGLQCAHEKCLSLLAESKSVVSDCDVSFKEDNQAFVSSMNILLNDHVNNNRKLMSANADVLSEMEKVEDNMKGLMEILKDIDTIVIPELDLSNLKMPSEEEIQRSAPIVTCDIPRLEKPSAPPTVEALVLIGKKMFGKAYDLLETGDENKEN
uniref:Kinesin motor domain-containing protein n=1 Tax=Parastrongyloides trichosuri TaxID=131310 RepID=A0A0N4ZFW1_PARTI